MTEIELRNLCSVEWTEMVSSGKAKMCKMYDVLVFNADDTRIMMTGANRGKLETYVAETSRVTELRINGVRFI